VDFDFDTDTDTDTGTGTGADLGEVASGEPTAPLNPREASLDLKVHAGATQDRAADFTEAQAPPGERR
jgi:hypothetical protein